MPNISSDAVCSATDSQNILLWTLTASRYSQLIQNNWSVVKNGAGGLVVIVRWKSCTLWYQTKTKKLHLPEFLLQAEFTKSPKAPDPFWSSSDRRRRRQMTESQRRHVQVPCSPGATWKGINRASPHRWAPLSLRLFILQSWEVKCLLRDDIGKWRGVITCNLFDSRRTLRKWSPAFEWRAKWNARKIRRRVG